MHAFVVSFFGAQLARAQWDRARQRVEELKRDGPAGDPRLLEQALVTLAARRANYDGARRDLGELLDLA